MKQAHDERAQHLVLLVLRRATARGLRSIPRGELVRSVLGSGDPNDVVLAGAIDDLLQRGLVIQRADRIAIP